LLDAPRHESLLGLDLRPVLQPVGQALRKSLQRLIGLQVARAGCAVAHADAGHAKFERAKFGGSHEVSGFGVER
jgi:hypothetical protein